MAKKRDGNGLEICSRIQKEFGKRFREARIKSKRLQKNIAFEMQLTRTTVSNIERGKQRLYLDQVFQAAHIFGVSVPELLPSVEDIYSQPKVMTPTDAPLSTDASEEVERIVSGLLDPRRGRPRAKARSKVAGRSQ